MSASIPVSSSISISRSSAGSALWDAASPGDNPGAVNRHLGIGWEFVHVCIDDASRVAFVQVMPDQRKESAVPYSKLPSLITPAWASRCCA
ncbi:hypothetical protein SAMN03159463_00821 [Mesorhizobium sp. NFR06]|nr:hypothetical protein SAMN03159463_00821 [Mesorhizobium sp. NFR06]